MKRGRRKYAKFRYRPWGGWAEQHENRYGVKRLRLTLGEQRALRAALFDSVKVVK